MKKSLLVMDVDGRLPSALVERLRRAFDVVPYRPGTDPQALLDTGSWSAVLLSSGNASRAALSIARHVKKSDPASVVVLMAPRSTNASCREALEAGVDVLVGAEDHAALCSALAARIGSSRLIL